MVAVQPGTNLLLLICNFGSLDQPPPRTGVAGTLCSCSKNRPIWCAAKEFNQSKIELGVARAVNVLAPSLVIERRLHAVTFQLSRLAGVGIRGLKAIELTLNCSEYDLAVASRMAWHFQYPTTS